MTLRTSVAALCGACLVLGFCPEASVAATATNLVTICTSATTTIQAAKCTAWQYNVYSPTAYIESYPTVTPAETGINDPNYEYRLASTLTPAMGVKVCPTALTPGVSFNSPQADPCPNNKLVAASTVLPIDTYAIAMTSAGVVVYQVNTLGVSVVNGSPFFANTSTNSYYELAIDPSGKYIYVASYDPRGLGPDDISSYGIANGIPGQTALSTSSPYDAGHSGPLFGQITATATHLYASHGEDFAVPASIEIFGLNNGVIKSGVVLSIPVPIDQAGPTCSFTVDSQERFLYMYLSSTGGTVSDTVAIYSLNLSGSSPSATLLQMLAQSGQVLLGAQ